MTDETPEPAHHGQVAIELAMLTILQARVKAEIDARRDTVARTWAGGTTIPLELPNPGNPARPIQVGKIRADGGQGIARISDPAAWQKWCLEQYGHNVTHQPAGLTSWQLDAKSRYALTQAGEQYLELASGFGADVGAATTAMLDALEAEGYTLTKRQAVPERIVVQESWEKVVLEATQKAGLPVTPNGDTPEGVEFVPAENAPVRPVVTIGKDEAIRTAFVQAHRGILPALTGTITPEEAGNDR